MPIKCVSGWSKEKTLAQPKLSVMQIPHQLTLATTTSESPFPSKQPKKSCQVDPLDAFGLNGFARALGVGPDSVLAVTTTLLTGLAGPEAWLQSPWGQTRLTKLDLLTSKEDFGMGRLIDCLTAPLSLINRRLVEKKGGLSPDAIDLLTSGPFTSAAAAKHANADMRDKSLRRHLDALTPATRPGDSGLLRQDLVFDPVTHRRESLMHPQFLVKGVDGRSLKPLVEDCHLRTALVVQPLLGLTREGSEPSRVIKMLFALLDGTVVKKRTGPLDRGRDSSLTTKAHALLSLTKDEISVLASMSVGHLNRFLWLAESVGEPVPPGDADAGEVFLSAFQAAVMEILELRREGRGVMVSFASREGLGAFEEEALHFEAEIVHTATEVGAWARGLPQSIFWALDFLRHSMSGDHGIDDESLTAVAFAGARRLLYNHRNQVRLITNAQLLTDRRLLAGRIVQVLEKTDIPLKLHELVRSFSRQEKSRFDPVIDALLDTGVLSRDEKQRLSLGSVDLADVEEELAKLLVATQ